MRTENKHIDQSSKIIASSSENSDLKAMISVMQEILTNQKKLIDDMNSECLALWNEVSDLKAIILELKEDKLNQCKQTSDKHKAGRLTCFGRLTKMERLQDHLVLTSKSYYSFRDEGEI